MIRHLPITGVLLLVLAGCQGVWTRIDARAVNYKADHYTVDLPVDWVRAQAGEVVYITRDGIAVQRVAIEFREHAEAFGKTGQKSEAGMLPSELAERYIAEMRANDTNGLPSLEILSSRPVTIDRRPGFELHLRFLSEDGLRYERLVSGLASEDGYFEISYQAPTLYFFERDRGAFDSVIGSFRAI